MCRLFGMSAGEERARATFWLLEAPDSLSAQSHREPDGTGIGWFDGHDEPHLSKQAIAAYEDARFAAQAHELMSRTFVAHVRFASTGALELRNTHPFEQEGRLFAHNGVIEDLDALDAHLEGARRLVHGDTDSERLFALITRETAAAGGDVEAGIVSACSWVALNLPLLAINFVLSTAERVFALRYPDTHELYVLEREPGSRLEQRSNLGTRISSEHGAGKPLVVIASERMDEDAGWRPLASGELLQVTPTLEVSSRRILEGPPARPLKLADLEPRARASQAAAIPPREP
ncbi:MAG TPA: class II glutamine amidotransferase [Solirubrobacteraceae bacterium]|jgi:glutamine amidotransferase|nr:class II glutamine amidotransferase [Solirubrobacteraceae bacterium]